MSILICGEALYDLFQTGARADGALSFDACSGGSPFNVAIGVSRLGGKSALLSGISTDMLGSRLYDRLCREGVDTSYIQRSGRRTTLSVVGLDASGSPDYAFYGVGSADCALTRADMPVLPRDIQALHFGSYSLVMPPVADAFAELAAGNAARFISLDPNIRPTIEPDMRVWQDRIDAIRRHADLIKVSAEDLAHLQPDQAPDEIARSWAADGRSLVILTAGGEEISAYRGDKMVSATPPPVKVANTVGAGDAVQASLLAQLQQRDVFSRGIADVTLDDIAELIATAAHAGAMTCTQQGATLPVSASQNLPG